MEKNLDKGQSVANLLKIHMEYWPSQVILTAVELDLFSQLGNNELTAEELGKKINIHPRVTYDFFDALVALSFLERNGEGVNAKYSNITGGVELFDDQKGMMFKGYELWKNLKTALKTGKSLTGLEQTERNKNANYEDLYYQNEQHADEFYHAMNGIQRENFNKLAEVFNFSDYKTISDIGCASGLSSIILAKKHKHLYFTNFDLPSVLTYTKKQVKEAGMEGRIKLQSGNFKHDSFPKSDIVIMSNILHNWDLDTKKMLIKKAYDAILPGGALIIVETIIDNERRKNINALLMSLNMLIEFGSGFSFTENDFRSWCEVTGFKRFEFKPLVGASSAAIAYK